MLELQLLGSPQIVRDDAPIRDLTSTKSQALLFYLAMKGRPYSRLALGGLLWPDKSDTVARVNLRQAVRHLRLALGDYLLATRETVALNERLPLTVDARLFANLVASNETGALQQAVDLYSGEFLSGFYIEDVLDYENWILLERERLRALVLQALQTLSHRYAQAGDVTEALHATARLLALEPWHEEAYREMMRLLAEDGQFSAALAQYETCRQVLAADVGAAPSAETTALYEAIRRRQMHYRAHALATAGAQPAIPHNLPRQFTAFIGRDVSVDQISVWLQQPACALITIHGPGGAGKTRLAVEAAYRNLANYADGAWFVDLATVTRPENLFSAIAAGLGLSLSGHSDVREQVLAYLQERRLLLIIDNFEHLLTAAPTLLEILHQARRVQILVTSRFSLHLQAEWLFAVEGLSIRADAGTEETMPAAVQLFLQRMRQVRPGYEPTPAELAEIGEICRRTGGMPLAIELAAALTRSQTIAEIRADIGTNGDALDTALRDVPERQRSLRAVFDYSWNLLSAEEQRALAALSIFRGAFTAVAAATIADTNDKMLLALQDKSLLQAVIPGRYELHALLQQYAAEKGGGAPESDAVRRCHMAFYLTFVRERAEALWQSGAQLALAEIRREWGNIIAAWHEAVASGELRLLAESEAGVYDFHVRAGLLREGGFLFGEAAAQLARAAEVDTAASVADAALSSLLARLLARQARFLAEEAKYEEVSAVARQALDYASAARDAASIARANLVWARALSQQGDLAGAQEHLEQARQQAATAGATRLLGAALASMGVLHFHRGEHDAAEACLRQAAAAFAETEGYGGKAQVHNNLANIAARRGDYVAAKQAYEQALTVYRTVGEYGGEALVLGNLGIVASHMNRFDEATALTEQALGMSREAHMRRLVCALLNTRGGLQLRQGDLDAAGTSLEEALSLARTIGSRYTESETLSNCAQLALYRGATEVALQRAQEALRAAQLAGEHTLSGFAWMALARAREAAGMIEAAAEAYRSALDVRQALGHRGLILETEAGLARMARYLGAGEQVQKTAEMIWTALAPMVIDDNVGAPLYGTEEPCRILLTCYDAFRAVADGRAATVLTYANGCVERWASTIAEERLRRSFLENVPAHRELRRALAR